MAPKPDPNTRLQQAFYLHRSGNVVEAVWIYRELLPNFRKNAQFLFSLGSAETQCGNLAEGVNLLKKSLKIAPANPEAHTNLGIALFDLRRIDDALASFDRAIRINPDLAEAHNGRGNALQDLNRLDEALASYERAIRLRPTLAEIHSNHGNVLRNLKRFDDALVSYDRAIQLNPGLAEVHSNRGSVLRILKRLNEALLSYERAIELNPNLAEAYSGQGCALLELKHLDDALASFDRAIQLDPEHADAHFNKSHLKLLTGDFDEGWRLYEWRRKSSTYKNSIRKFERPLWLGQDSIAGKTILVHAEQGLGDVIQFCRYLPALKSLGSKVVFEVPSSLMALISTLKCDVVVVERGKQLPYFDIQCPIMSLPLAFKTTLHTIPAGIPYLCTDPGEQQTWQQRLGIKGRPRIGLAWSGSVDHMNDPSRSIGLELIRPLLELPFEFHSLHKEYRKGEMELLIRHPQIKDHRDELGDFSNTAALIRELDLVISVDTSIAHLAGALGKSVWILLPFLPDFRWMLDRSTSPWYPTATLFRQPAIGDWDSVVRRARDTLSAEGRW